MTKNAENNRIKTPLDLIKRIKEEFKGPDNEVSHLIKGITARFLLFILIYFGYIKLSPIKELLPNSGLFLILYTGFNMLCQTIKEYIPPTVNSVLNGKIFMEIDSPFLDACILTLFAFCLFLFYIPLDFIERVRSYFYRFQKWQINLRI